MTLSAGFVDVVFRGLGLGATDVWLVGDAGDASAQTTTPEAAPPPWPPS